MTVLDVRRGRQKHRDRKFQNFVANVTVSEYKHSGSRAEIKKLLLKFTSLISRTITVTTRTSDVARAHHHGRQVVAGTIMGFRVTGT